MDEQNRLEPQAALSYMLGGKATVVIHSATSGDDWRFKVVKKDDRLWYVYDDYHYTSEGPIYLGFIRNHGLEYWFKDAERLPDKYPENTLKYLIRSQFVLRETIRVLSDKFYPEKLHFYHMGHCSACGRPLTDPVSLRLGLGPICRGGKQ